MLIAIAALRGDELFDDPLDCTAAATALGRVGLWVEALNLLPQLPRATLQPNAIIVCSVIGACSKGQEWSCPVHLLGGLQRTGASPDIIVLNGVLSACARGQAWQFAIQISSMMPHIALERNCITSTAALSACG